MREQRGFTLAEVLVVIGLIGILSVFAVGIFFSNNQFYLTQSGEINSIISTRLVSDRINEYGRAATAVIGSHVFGPTTYTTGLETVIFRIPAINGSGGIISGTDDYVVVSKDLSNSSRLILVLEPNAASVRKSRDILLTDKLNSVSFTYDDADPTLAKNVNYEIRVTEGGRYPAGERVTGGVTLRNK